MLGASEVTSAVVIGREELRCSKPLRRGHRGGIMAKVIGPMPGDRWGAGGLETAPSPTS